MMKIILSFFIFISTASFSQSADFIILKKHHKKIDTYFSGGYIAFTSSNGSYVNALINGIKNDTLYLQEFVVQRVLTVLGTYKIDTIGSYHYKYHYNQIKAIGKAERRNFNLKGSGMELMGGGALLVIGSGIVYLADREKFSAPLLIAAAGLGVAGYFLSKDRSHGMLIGKKYQLEYMNMSEKVNR